MDKLQCPHCENKRKYQPTVNKYSVTCGSKECSDEARRLAREKKKIKCQACKEHHPVNAIPVLCTLKLRKCVGWGIHPKDYDKEVERRDLEQTAINLRCARL